MSCASRFSRAPAAIFSSAFDDIFKQKAVALYGDDRNALMI